MTTRSPIAHPPVTLKVTSIVALIAAVAVLRVGNVGSGISIQYDFVAMGHGIPNFLFVGGASAIQAITEMISAPFFARLGDRYGTRQLLRMAPLFGCGSALLLSIASHPVLFIPALILGGCASGAFVPISLSVLARFTEHHTKSRATSSSFFEGATLLGYAGGYVAGPLLWASYGRIAFLFLALLYLLCAVICLFAAPTLPPTQVTPIRELTSRLLSSPTVLRFLPAWLCANAIIGVFTANFAALFHRKRDLHQNLIHHFGAHTVAGIGVVLIIVLVVGIMLWIPWVIRLGPSTAMVRSIAGGWIVCVGLLFVNHLPFHYLGLGLPIVVVGLLLVAGFGPSALTYLAACSEEFRDDRAALMAIYTIALAGGSALGAALGGIAARLFLFDGIIAVVAVLATIAFLMAQSLHDPVSSSPEAT